VRKPGGSRRREAFERSKKLNRASAFCLEAWGIVLDFAFENFRGWILVVSHPVASATLAAGCRAVALRVAGCRGRVVC